MKLESTLFTLLHPCAGAPGQCDKTSKINKGHEKEIKLHLFSDGMRKF